MRRADRLFALVQVLRRRPVVTAAFIARELEVSERTIYRDIRDLVLSGVPIDGEAGVGYTLRRGFDLPPLMFTAREIEAMVLGARFVASWGDAGLARAAGEALARIEVVLPPALRERIEGTPLFAPGFHIDGDLREILAKARAAVEERRKLRFTYRDVGGAETARTVRPIALTFWGAAWSVAAWCELRTDFRAFRLDRIESLVVLDDWFVDEPGRTLDEFLRTREVEDGALA